MRTRNSSATDFLPKFGTKISVCKSLLTTQQRAICIFNISFISRTRQKDMMLDLELPHDAKLSWWWLSGYSTRPNSEDEAIAGEDESESENSDEGESEDEEGLWQELQWCNKLGGEVGPLITHSLLLYYDLANYGHRFGQAVSAYASQIMIYIWNRTCVSNNMHYVCNTH